MGSRVVTTTYHKCDRCGNEIACRSDEDEIWRKKYSAWGSIKVQRKSGGSVIGTADGYNSDLCKECVDELERWLKHGGKLND